MTTPVYKFIPLNKGKMVRRQKPIVPKNVFFTGLVSFFTDVSSEMLFPILPIFLIDVLKISKSLVGLIEGFADSVTAFASLFSGWLSDKIHKRKMIIGAGYFLSSISKIFLFFASIWQHIFFIRLFDRLGKGSREAPRDALIAETTKEHGKAFGFHRMMDTLGALTGVIITIVLLGYSFKYKTIFLISVIPAFISVLIIIFFVKESRSQKKIEEFKFKLVDLPKNVKIFLGISFLFGLADFSYAFLVLKAKETGIALILIPVVYLLYNIIYALTAYPIGLLSDKISKIKIYFLGIFIFTVVCLTFAYTTNRTIVWFLFAFYGLFKALTFGTGRAYVSDIVKKDRGTIMGIYHLVIGIAILPSSLIAGFLWDNLGSAYSFLFSGCIAFISLILITKYFKKELTASKN